MTLRQDVWLSGVLGFPVYESGADAELPPVQTRSLTYAKIDVADVETLATLTIRGFAVVDVNVTLTHDARAGSLDCPTNVAPAAPEQFEALGAIGGRAFKYSRFHLDPKIPRELADRVKREWVMNYAAGRRGVELLSAVEDGTPVGFLAVLENGDARIIDLVAVAPEAQGRGVGRALVSGFIARHHATARVLRVGTQLANIPSIRLYESLGFRMSGAAYVLHRHEVD